MSNQSNGQHKAQIVYFSHGGGPLPVLADAGHVKMVDFMRKLPSQLRSPEAILVISAHWEENVATLLGAERPPMFYDYYGFAQEAYTITYPAPGNPQLADRITNILKKHLIPASLNTQRGFDHGLFIPLKLIYPKADIPALQLSLLRSLDPAAHISLGKALGSLASENILVLGSGFSFHNMREFSWEGNARKDAANNAFQDWLIETCTLELSSKEREKRLVEWEKAPSARYCHPREEHLLPLHICQAMADKPGKLIFDDYIMGKRAVALLWQC